GVHPGRCRSGPLRAGVDSRHRRRTASCGIRRRVPDVLDRAGVQPGEALSAASRRVRARVFPGPAYARCRACCRLTCGSSMASRRSHELFILNVLLITLGLAWLTDRAGLSLALGAFLAGMLIAETEYRHQVEEDIRPFREVLLGLFFVTIGMRLDLGTVAANLWLTLSLTALLIVFKFILVASLARLFGAGPGAAVRTGLALAQVGEFCLVL